MAGTILCAWVGCPQQPWKISTIIPILQMGETEAIKRLYSSGVAKEGNRPGPNAFFKSSHLRIVTFA